MPSFKTVLQHLRHNALEVIAHRKTPQNTHISAFAGWAVVVLVLSTYNLVFFNRYFPLTEGWFSIYAQLLTHGRMMYRDFYFFLPPLYVLETAVFIFLFGLKFIYLRIAGIFVIVFLATAYYLILIRWFPTFAACFATIVSVMYYQSGVAHVTYDFIHLMTFWGLVSLLFIVKHTETPPVEGSGLSRDNRRYLFIAGVSAACAFLTKQSNGFFIALFCGVAVTLGSIRWGMRYALISSGIFIGSAALPVALIAFWLGCHGALSACAQQMYFDALQAKGSWDSVLFGWSRHFFGPGYFIYVREIISKAFPFWAFNAIGLIGGWTLMPEETRSNKLNLSFIALGAIVSLYGVLLPFYQPLFARQAYAIQITPFIINSIIVLSTALTFLLFLVSLLLLLFKRDRLHDGLFVFSIVTLGFICGNGTSAGLSEVSCFLTLAFFMCLMMSFRGDLMIGKIVILILGCSYITYVASNKYDRPYTWWFIEEPNIRKPLRASTLPLLGGFKISSETAGTLERVTAIIKARSRPDEPIYTFPHIPIFLLTSERQPSTPAVVQWFDFLPDQKAITEAQALRAAPPAVIVEMVLPELVWTEHERLFRHKNPLAQRKIHQAIADLTQKSGAYREDAAIPLRGNCVLKVWSRRRSG